MPDKSGAFLKASKIISVNGGNIVRVNYNKTVDVHTLFLDVAGNAEQLEKISAQLKEMGYISDDSGNEKVILISLTLTDIPGALQPVLELLNQYDVNISYMSAQENGTAYQHFKMGLFIENPHMIKNLLDDLSKICDIMILDYDVTEKVLDNTIFYISFSNEMRKMLLLTQEETNEVIINSNKIMQILDEKNLSPSKTFEYIRKFAKFIVEHKGVYFKPRISKRQISDKVTLHLIEPPCGSNTYILESEKELLFVDCGFSCYADEMKLIFNSIIENFDGYEKNLLLTHSDIDHSGLTHIFKTVYLSKDSYENYRLENEGLDNFREQNFYHAPHYKLSRIFCGYTIPSLENMKIVGEKTDDYPLSKIGEFAFEDLKFEIYQGNGGHVKGEIIFICHDRKLAFTGDNLVNIKDFSDDQRQFNVFAPYLMTSVNIDSEKATLCRNVITEKTKGYLICSGHGAWFDNV